MGEAAGPKTLTITDHKRERTCFEPPMKMETYNVEVEVKPLTGKAAVQPARKDGDKEAKFMTFACGESMDAITRFAGDGPRKVPGATGSSSSNCEGSRDPASAR